MKKVSVKILLTNTLEMFQEKLLKLNLCVLRKKYIHNSTTINRVLRSLILIAFIAQITLGVYSFLYYKTLQRLVINYLNMTCIIDLLYAFSNLF